MARLSQRKYPYLSGCATEGENRRRSRIGDADRLLLGRIRSSDHTNSRAPLRASRCRYAQTQAGSYRKKRLCRLNLPGAQRQIRDASIFRLIRIAKLVPGLAEVDRLNQAVAR